MSTTATTLLALCPRCDSRTTLEPSIQTRSPAHETHMARGTASRSRDEVLVILVRRRLRDHACAEVLWVDGPEPRVAGERFGAYLKPRSSDRGGCAPLILPDGTRGIACRGRVGPNDGRGRRRDYLFDPDFHEVLRP